MGSESHEIPWGPMSDSRRKYVPGTRISWDIQWDVPSWNTRVSHAWDNQRSYDGMFFVPWKNQVPWDSIAMRKPSKCAPLASLPAARNCL